MEYLKEMTEDLLSILTTCLNFQIAFLTPALKCEEVFVCLFLAFKTEYVGAFSNFCIGVTENEQYFIK